MLPLVRLTIEVYTVLSQVHKINLKLFLMQSNLFFSLHEFYFNFCLFLL